MNFLDTNLLLNDNGNFPTEKFMLSSISIEELENIKTSNRDNEIKYQARRALHFLDEHPELYEIFIWTEKLTKYIKKYSLVDNNDSRIIISALEAKKKNPDLVFCTKDLSCYTIAKNIVGLKVNKTVETEEAYTGFLNLEFKTEDELAAFYNKIYDDKTWNPWGLKVNQYLILRDECGAAIEAYKWMGEGLGLDKVPYHTINTIMFDKVQPLDVYQQCVIDSFENNQINVIAGVSGGGKSYLSLAYMFKLLEGRKIDKIVIFANTVPTRGASEIGFLPGDRRSKLLESSIGNFLISHLGDIAEVEKLMDKGLLDILPMCDLRGFDLNDMRCGLYITEAQNMDIELMRLVLTRVGADTFVILDGDHKSQVDSPMYAGNANGLRRVIKVFSGSPLFGMIELQEVKRSEIARLALQL